MASSYGTIPFSLTANRLQGQEASPFMARVRSYKTMGGGQYQSVGVLTKNPINI